jgi:hypothetical protein
MAPVTATTLAFQRSNSVIVEISEIPYLFKQPLILDSSLTEQTFGIEAKASRVGITRRYADWLN